MEIYTASINLNNLLDHGIQLVIPYSMTGLERELNNYSSIYWVAAEVVV